MLLMTGSATDFRVELTSTKSYKLSRVLYTLQKTIDVKLISGQDETKSTLIRNIKELNPNIVTCCPRVHGKVILVDFKKMYIGSGNLTARGMGILKEDRTNWEVGVLLDEVKEVLKVVKLFQSIWRREHCQICDYKGECNYKTTKIR